MGRVGVEITGRPHTRAATRRCRGAPCPLPSGLRSPAALTRGRPPLAGGASYTSRELRSPSALTRGRPPTASGVCGQTVRLRSEWSASSIKERCRRVWGRCAANASRYPRNYGVVADRPGFRLIDRSRTSERSRHWRRELRQHPRLPPSGVGHVKILRACRTKVIASHLRGPTAVLMRRTDPISAGMKPVVPHDSLHDQRAGGRISASPGMCFGSTRCP
jgi:hypothetical protein